MVSVAPAGLTRIGFRRDVKLFLTALVGFLVVLILALLLLLQNFVMTSEELIRAQWKTLADVGAQVIEERSRDANPIDHDTLLSMLRARYSIPAIRLKTTEGRVVNSGAAPFGNESQHLDRETAVGKVTFVFDSTPLDAMHQLFIKTAIICIAATLAGTILLFLYLPRIVRPIEEMLDHARQLGEQRTDVEESRYLIETFKGSIALLKRQEEELKRLHELEKSRADDLELVTATLTRSMSSGLIALDADGRVVDANGVAREILGIDPARPLGGVDLARAIDPGTFYDVLRQAHREQASLSRKEIALGSEGEEKIVGLTTVPLIKENTEFLGMMALFTDLTLIRRLETRLRETQNLADLGEISAGIAHEFRNSLSTILGYLKLARREPLSPEVDKRLHHAMDEASLLSQAVEGLLSFARPVDLDRQSVDVRELVETIVEKLQPAAGNALIEITGDAPTCECDPVLLGRGLENVIRNSIDAVETRKDEGRIEISITGEPQPSIRIADNGIGIDPADTTRLFLPFQSGKPNGMGLGLALTRKIVLLHGGEIRMTGFPGHGATVVIDLPASVPSTQA